MQMLKAKNAIVTGATPLAKEAWGFSNKMTSSALGAIGEVGGSRCCKRDSYLAIVKAVEFVREHLGVEMELSDIKCVHSAQNNQCIGKRCFLRKVRKYADIYIQIKRKIRLG